MQPKIAGLVLGIILLPLGACSDKAGDQTGTPPTSGGPSSSQSATASPGASSGPVVGGVDKKTVCAGVTKAQGEAQAKLQIILPKAAEAMGDPAKAGPVLTELRNALLAYETALAAEAARSQDGELRAAIDADVAALRKAGKDLQAAGTDVEKALNALQTPEFTAAGEKVRTLCEK